MGHRNSSPGDARRVLVLVFKFPDVIVPGGSVRTEKFLTYLPNRWAPIVLSVRIPEAALHDPIHRAPFVHRTPSHYGVFARAYRTMHLDGPRGLRARAIDFVRRVKNLVLVPDDALLWWPRALPEALRLVRRHRPEIIFATGPPFSVPLLGSLVSRMAGVPLVADFRDDWAGNPSGNKPGITEALTARAIEGHVIRRAVRVVHVTPASVERYRRRYPAQAERMVLIPNGYDEADFAGLTPGKKPAGRLRILHAGSLKEGRSPLPVLEAIRRLEHERPDCRSIRLTQFGTTHREHLEAVEAAGLSDTVTWGEYLPRREVVRRMVGSDALLLIPTRFSPTAVPGKAYEYLRAGRPLLVMAPESAATRLLAGFRGVVVRDPGDVAGIAGTLEAWFDAADPPAPDPQEALAFSRESQAGELADLLDEVAHSPRR